MVDLSNFDYNTVGYVHARSFHANTSIALVDIGIQIFMCFYGLSIFLETPKAQRAGRTPYIVVSFTILLLSTLSASLDAYVTFRMGWESTSGRDSYRVTAELEASWQRVLSLSVLFAYMCIGDGLLLYRCYVIWSDRPWFSVLPGLTYLASVGMGIRTLLPQSVPMIRHYRTRPGLI